MAGKKMAKKFDVTSLKDSDKLFIQNKGLRAFSIIENGKAGKIEPGKTYEVTGRTAKALCAYPEIEIVSVDLKDAKALTTKAVEEARQKIKSLEEKVATLEEEKKELQERVDQADDLDQREADLQEKTANLDQRENLLGEERKAFDAEKEAFEKSKEKGA